jgi:hypothetical protein
MSPQSARKTTSGARKTTSGARKSTSGARKSTADARKSTDPAQHDGARSGTDNARASSPVAAARQAMSELAELLGREPEGMISVQRVDDGWRIGVEVVEVRRIPDTADVLAEYDVDADGEGHLTGYRRARRYARGRVRDD